MGKNSHNSCCDGKCYEFHNGRNAIRFHHSSCRVEPKKEAMPTPAPKPSVRVIEELRGLLAEAGKWPDELIPEGDGKYFECPACGGEGSIEGEVVHCLHAGLVGVQVYGIGDQMAAMEKLLPLLIRHGPALLAVAEACQELGVEDSDSFGSTYRKIARGLSALDATGGGL